MSIALIKQIERNIKIKMKGIKDGSITPKESRIGFQFNRLKDLDQASYENLLSQYKQILK
jgi:hypothetical protein